MLMSPESGCQKTKSGRGGGGAGGGNVETKKREHMQDNFGEFTKLFVYPKTNGIGSAKES